MEEKFQGICGNLTDQVAGKYELVGQYRGGYYYPVDQGYHAILESGQYLSDERYYRYPCAGGARCPEPRFTILEERQEKGWFALAAKTKKLTRCVRSYFLLGESLPVQVLSLRGSLELVYFCFMLFLSASGVKKAGRGGENKNDHQKSHRDVKPSLWLFRYRL